MLKQVLPVVENVLKVSSAKSKKTSAVSGLLHHVNTYYAPDFQFPEKYLDIIDTPMCISLILEKLIERGRYVNRNKSTIIPKKGSKNVSKNASDFVFFYPSNNIEEIINDIKLIKSNIQKYGEFVGVDVSI